MSASLLADAAHQKQARLIAEPWQIKRRRGECDDAYSARLGAMREAWLQSERDKFDVAEAERQARGERPWGPAGEAVRRELGLRHTPHPADAAHRPPSPWKGEGLVALPDLAQVTGWSRADPGKAPHHPGRALFGGWRLEAGGDEAEAGGLGSPATAGVQEPGRAELPRPTLRACARLGPASAGEWLAWPSTILYYRPVSY